MISKLFTHGRSHLGCSLVLMLQNIFPKDTQSRTISINTQYQVPFCNPRDSLQISILAHQLCPHNSKDFLEIYKRATQRPYGYLFCCFTQSCPDEIRYRTKVLLNEYPSIVYQLNFNPVSFEDPFMDPLCSRIHSRIRSRICRDPFKDPFKGSKMWRNGCCLPINIVAIYTCN